VLHELWVDADGLDTYCLAGPMGDAARALMAQPATLVWTVEASCHLDAMQRYYAYRGWPAYTTDFPEIDRQTYRERGWE
jgi:hypothetical protein